MKTTLLLGGQGAVMPTLGVDLYENEPVYKQVIDQASAVLEYDLYTFVLTNEEKLKQTAYAQAAIFAHEMGIYTLIKDQLDEPVSLLGLSLGEYTALTIAGVFEFSDALRLLQKRGHYMQVASEQEATQMMAILGKDPAPILDAITSMQMQDEPVYLANYNTMKQIVVGGTEQALQTFSEYVQTQTKVRCISLPVAGAFHTPFMGSAALALREDLMTVSQHTPVYPVYSNTTKQPFESNVTTTLTTQMTTPTFFAEAFKNLTAETQPDRVIEIGPDGTLLKFAQQLNSEITGISLSDLASVQQFKEQSYATNG